VTVHRLQLAVEVLALGLEQHQPLAPLLARARVPARSVCRTAVLMLGRNVPK
jgi:hypothetical protein